MILKMMSEITSEVKVRLVKKIFILFSVILLKNDYLCNCKT